MAARHRKAKAAERQRRQDQSERARQRSNVRAAIAPKPRPGKYRGLRVSANPDKLTNPKRDSKYRRAANPEAAIPAGQFAERYKAHTVPAASIAPVISDIERARAAYFAEAYATETTAPNPTAGRTAGTTPDYVSGPNGASIPYWIGASVEDVDRDANMHARDPLTMSSNDEREYPGETRYGYARIRDGETAKPPPTNPDGTYRHVHETAKNFEERNVAAPADGQAVYMARLEGAPLR